MRTTFKRTQKRIQVTGPTEHHNLNVREANNTKTKHSLQATEFEAEKEFSQNKDVFVSFFLHVQKREGTLFPLKKERKEENGRKKNWLLPTYHPPSPGWDVVAELPFDGAFWGFSCHYAVSKLHLMLVHSPEIRHLIEKTFALACWATCSPLHTIWNHG